MSDLSDYRTPTPPGREFDTIFIFPSEDEQPKSPISQTHRESSIPPLQDRVDADGRHPEPHSPNSFQNLFEQLLNQHNDLRTQIHQAKSAVSDAAADVVETSALFKAEEAEIQEVLTRVRNIVGPRVAKWIDEDIEASMKAGKLVCRDLSALDAEFNLSDDEDGDPSKSKHGGGEGHDEDAGHSSSYRKGKRKAKDNDQSYGSNDSTNEGRTECDTQSGSRTRSNQRKRSAESQPAETTGRQKRSRISPTRSSSIAAPSPLSEKPSSPLKRAREEVEDNDDGSEDEVEKSITMQRSFSSILEDSSPVSKKARRQGSYVSDISTSSLSGSSTSPGNKSHGSSVSSQTGTTNNHAGPSTSSHSTTGRLFPPSSFPQFRPPEPPKRPYEPRAKPLQRDTYRVRANPDTGEFEVFDYESTEEYKERLQRDRYDIHIQVPMVCDFKADLRTMSELDGPHFKFDRDAWRNFEDHTLVS